LAQRLVLPIAKDTSLRVLRRQAPATPAAARVVGIDGWAWRRRHHYRTLICDLERRHGIYLLPEREPATVKAGMASRPGVAVVARDRAGGYAGAVAEAAPRTAQVADCWAWPCDSDALRDVPCPRVECRCGIALLRDLQTGSVRAPTMPVRVVPDQICIRARVGIGSILSSTRFTAGISSTSTFSPRRTASER
jgi:hypothetical protein